MGKFTKGRYRNTSTDEVKSTKKDKQFVTRSDRRTNRRTNKKTMEDFVDE